MWEQVHGVRVNEIDGWNILKLGLICEKFIQIFLKFRKKQVPGIIWLVVMIKNDRADAFFNATAR